ncbi:hypothetical protein D018_1397A, partial [Vibrio parahaemolyticus VP2007-007]
MTRGVGIHHPANRCAVAGRQIW